MDTALTEYTERFRHMPPVFLCIPWKNIFGSCLDLIRIVLRFAVVGVAGVVLATVWLLLSILAACIPHGNLPQTITKLFRVDNETRPSRAREPLPSSKSRKPEPSPPTPPTPTSSSSTLVQPCVESHVRFATQPEHSVPRPQKSPSRGHLDTDSPTPAAFASEACDLEGRIVSAPEITRANTLLSRARPRRQPPRMNSAPPALAPTPFPGQTFSNNPSNALASSSGVCARRRSREKVPKLAAHDCVVDSVPERHSKICVRKQNTFPTPPVQRTDPYQAPYFFPSPASPEAATYVAEVRTSRVPFRLAPMAVLIEPQAELEGVPANDSVPSIAASSSSSAPPVKEVISRPEGHPDRSVSESTTKTTRRRSWHIPLPRPRLQSIGADPRPQTFDSAEPSPRPSRPKFRLKPKSHTTDAGVSQLSPLLSARHDGVPSEFGEVTSSPPPVRRTSWRDRFHHRRASSLDDGPLKMRSMKKAG